MYARKGKHVENLIKKIEKLVCNNFEDLEIDDPKEEGIYDEYMLVKGATDKQIQAFEEKFGITMPKDMKELYHYKNGSQGFYLLFPNDKYGRDFNYRLLSLEEIEEQKEYFQNKDVLLTEFYSYEEDSTKKLLEEMKDSRIKPYLHNKMWFPFAEAPGGISLMMDFDPNDDGVYGQIICYIHDPDEIAYVAKTITEIINDTMLNITL
ncbi:MAG: SMI1/KNR4 family protein [Lachnospiraceae bacterium]|nr:SMI1/KNR4 family protein [Lachnospiraceae bacterium]